MATHYEHAKRWLDWNEGRTDLKPFNRNRSNVFASYDGKRLLSYGEHFTLAERMPWGYLLNGDRYSSSTSKHQAIVRNVMQGIGHGRVVDGKWKREEFDAVTHYIVPFEALAAASIKFETITPIDSLPDRSEVVRVKRPTFPSWVTYYAGNAEQARRSAMHADSEEQRAKLREDERMWMEYHADSIKGFREKMNVVDLPEGGYEYDQHVHRLGEFLFSAEVEFFNRETREVETREAYFISAWDRQDTSTYFLSELPHSVGSLDEAYEALKPETVKRGEMEGRAIARQGDIFAVETSLSKRALTKMGATYERMAYMLGTNHVATEVATLPNGAVLARGLLWHKPEGRASDHRRQEIPGGNNFAVIVRNTVPQVK